MHNTGRDAENLGEAPGDLLLDINVILNVLEARVGGQILQYLIHP